jgi:DNA polymerase-1
MTTIVLPAYSGYSRFTAAINAGFTAGREYVADAIENLFRQTGTLACDIETYGVGTDARRLKSVSFGTPHEAVVCDPRDPQQWKLIRDTIERAETLVFHNGVYDVVNLYLNRLMDIAAINKTTDTIIYSRMAAPSDNGGHDLFKAGQKYAGLAGENHLTAAFKALGLSADNGWRDFDLDRPIYLQGAAADVIVTARLYKVLPQAAYDQTTRDHPFTTHGVTGSEAWELIEREQRVNRVLLRRACKGIVVDLEYLDKYRQIKSGERQESERELEKIGVKPGDSDDLIRWMVDNDQLPEGYPRVGKTKKLSGQAKHVEQIPHPVAELFVRHKKDLKIEKDYLVKCADMAVLGDDGLYRVNPVTHVLKAATGRAAMADPPLHQFNGPARNILMADPGDEWTSIDWSAIEPVIVANLAGEASMYLHYETWYPDKKDRETGELGTYGDIYEGIAEMAEVERKIAKVILLAQLYGEGIVKLSADLKVPQMSAKQLKAKIFEGLPNVEHFIDTMKQTAGQYEKVMTMSGRIIPVPWGSYTRDDGTVNYSVQRHKGINYTVQGSAYDELAHSIVEADKAGLGDAIYFTMHDEVICSTEAAHDVQQIMQKPPERLCRLSGRTPKLRTDRADMGNRWISDEQIKERMKANR